MKSQEVLINDAIENILILKHEWKLNNDEVIEFFKDEYEENFINGILNNEKMNYKYFQYNNLILIH
jgi:hypothetical protein